MRCNSNCLGNNNGNGNCNGNGNYNGNGNCNGNRNCGDNGGGNSGRNANSCCGFQPDYAPYYGMECGRNQTNVFAAGTTTTTTITGPTTTTIPITNILYNYGCAIQATTTGSSIYITQPGLYQISYAISVTNTAAEAQTFTAFLTRNTTQFATTTETDLAAGATATLADSELIYVSPQELPLTLSLNLTSTSTDTGVTADYTFFITINKICSCTNECGYVPSSPSTFSNSCFPFYNAPFESMLPWVMPAYTGNNGGCGCGCQRNNRYRNNDSCGC